MRASLWFFVHFTKVTSKFFMLYLKGRRLKYYFGTIIVIYFHPVK